jgi:ABC-type amino acid transport substrate-binding protein
VNQALAKMKSDGTLDQLTQKWLRIYTSIPALQP